MKRAGSTSAPKSGPLKGDQKSKSAHHVISKTQKNKTTGKAAAPVKVNDFEKQKSIEDVTSDKAMVPWIKREKPISLKGRFEDTDNLPNIVKAALKGVSPDVFYEFAKLIDMPDRYLAGTINTTPRTMSNYKEQKKKLDPVMGEHLLKLIGLCKKGETIFGNVYEFHNWLFKPQPSTIEIPGQLLVTPGGIDLVSQELDRVAYGYAL